MTPAQTLDWLADQHFDQCKEERPVQGWIRGMKSQLPETVTSEWKQYSITNQTQMYRGGWTGVWDALVSAITGKARATIAQPVTVSFWAKSNSEVSLTGVQAEYKEMR